MTLDALFQRARCHRVLTTEPDRENAVLVDVTRSDLAGAATGSEASWQSPAADAISFMLTTSGSTGIPKIVPLSVGAVDRFSDWAGAMFGMSTGTIVLNYAPLNFDLCLLDIWSTLKAGGCAVLVDQDQAMNPRYLVDLLTSSDVTVIQAVPVFYRLLLDAVRDRGCYFASVQHVIFTGYAMPAGLLAELPALFPDARFYNIYGCTETNDSFLHEANARQAVEPLPIGKPLPGVDACIVGEDGKAIVGAGMGELWVATPFQSPGYLDDASDKFVRFLRPGAPGEETWFRTGDVVRRNGDGTIVVVGRNDFRVKVRGVCVNLEEVEQALLQHGEIAEAVVVAIPDPLAGSRLLAVVRRNRASSVNSLELRTHCAQRLPRVAIPSTIDLTESPLPRTVTGKIDRQSIKNNLMEKRSNDDS